MKDNWISVEDRMPDHLEDVLAFESLDGPVVAYRDESNSWRTWVCTRDDVDIKVTHWQSLPEYPKEG